MIPIKEIEEKINTIIESEHMELVDAQLTSEHGKKVLRVFIDKDGGVKLADCEKMSDKLGAFIDQTDLMHGAYVLEVSSPGLDRVLKKENDFARFVGQKARITMSEPINGQRNFSGPIVSVSGGMITLNDVTGKTVTLAIDKMAKARLEPEL